MKDGTCVKCGSTEVYRRKQHYAQGISSLVISILKTIYLDIYACTTCGYIETYLPDEQAKNDIAKKWPRVQSEENSQ